MCNWVWSIIILLLSCCVENADAAVNKEDFFFTRLEFEDGLSQQTVFAIFQDSDHFIWIGTSDGLNRYDGYEFRKYGKEYEDPFYLEDNYIQKILQDSVGNIWVTTGWSVNCIHYQTEAISHYYFVQHKEREYMSTMFYTSDRRLLAFTEKNLYIYDSQRDTFCLYELQGEILPVDVLSVAEDRAGNFYLGTHAMGIFIYDREFRLVDRLLPGASEFRGVLPEGPLEELFFDGEDKMWMVSDRKHLLCYYPEERRFVRVAGLDWVVKVIDWDENYLLVGSSNGLFFVDKESFAVSAVDINVGEHGGLSHHYVTSLFKDLNGDLWVGTFYGGVNYCNKYNHRFNFVKSYVTGGVLTSGADDWKGRVWFAIDKGGLLEYDVRRHTQKSYWINQDGRNENNIKTVIADGDDVYFSMYGAQIYRFSIPDKKFHLVADYGVGDICTLLKDSKKRLWIPTNTGQGLIVLDKEKRVIDSLNLCKKYSRLAFIVSILEIDKNVFLLGTQFSGLYLYDENTGQFTMLPYSDWGHDGQIYIHVTSMLKDGAGDIWVATKSQGLYKLDNQLKLKGRYTQADGLPARIYGIAEHNGDIWLMNSREFYRFDPRQHTLECFPAIEEIMAPGTTVNAIFKGTDDRLYLPGTNGFLMIDPSKLVENSVIPPVVLTELKIDNEIIQPTIQDSPLSVKLNLQHKIVLRYDQTNLSIGYLALNYLYPQQNRYAYRMLGFENKWNEVGDRREAYYNNLQPGTYTFQVKGSNNDGVWNEEGAELQIVVLPPLWARWWAWAGYFLVVSVVVILIVRARHQKHELERFLHLKELEKEKLRELAEERNRFFTYAAHEFRTPLTLIINPLNEILQKYVHAAGVKESLLLIRRSAEKLLSLVNSLMEVEKREGGKLELHPAGLDFGRFVREMSLPFVSIADSRRIHFKTEVYPEYIPAFYDKEQLEPVFFNLLSNAFKFTPEEGHISLEVKLMSGQEVQKVAGERSLKPTVREWLFIRVNDDGIGIPKDQINQVFEPFYQGEKDLHGQIAGTGVGLSIVKSIIGQHEGIIFVGECEQGTDMCILLPYCPATEEQMQIGEKGEEEKMKRTADSERSKSMDINPAISNKMVLVVEDNPEALNYLEKQLSSDYRVVTATNGLEAWENIMREVPDMVISDVMMPEMDGIELCTKIKKDFRFSHIPVILLTAKVMQSQIEEGFEAGADDYISKPFSISLLKVRVRNLFANRKQMQKTFAKKFSLNELGFEVEQANKPFMERYVEIVRKNFRNPDLDADTIFCEMGMSRANFYKKLKTITDLSSNEIIRNIRLESAALLLKETKLSVSEVASQVGFSSVSYFGSCFKTRYGTSPKEYQNNAKKG